MAILDKCRHGELSVRRREQNLGYVGTGFGKSPSQGEDKQGGIHLDDCKTTYPESSSTRLWGSSIWAARAKRGQCRQP